jgi:hypothetical protein
MDHHLISNAIPVPLDGTKASRGRQARHAGRGVGIGEGVALEFGQDAGRAAAERARVAVAVGNARAADVGRARRGKARRVGRVQRTVVATLLGNIDIREDVALGQNVGTRGDLEGVAARVNVGPEVVDGVQERAAGNLGSTARGVVDVVVLEGDVVSRAGKVDGPVVVAVTGGRVVGVAVNLAVGNGHTAAGRSAQNDVLTTNVRGLP